jgi:hydroxymethylpyrimidine/phosphomethylpyrimidine kinase
MPPVALTIAGSDPSGGAGIQGDLKTFHQFGVYGTTVITLLTVQNTCRVSRVKTLEASLVLEQLDAVLGDLSPQAAKTGALGSSAVIRALAERAGAFSFPLVVDPVMISKHGAALLEEEARAALKSELLPRAFLVMPNVYEAAVLSGRECRETGSLEEAARAIADLGPRAVLVKGGHLGDDATDVLFFEGGIHRYPSQRIQTKHTHGTGCTYSAAITALLARKVELREAVRQAKQFITRAIETNPGLGQGFGPVNHWAPV